MSTTSKSDATSTINLAKAVSEIAGILSASGNNVSVHVINSVKPKNVPKKTGDKTEAKKSSDADSCVVDAPENKVKNKSGNEANNSKNIIGIEPDNVLTKNTHVINVFAQKKDKKTVSVIKKPGRKALTFITPQFELPSSIIKRNNKEKYIHDFNVYQDTDEKMKSTINKYLNKTLEQYRPRCGTLSFEQKIAYLHNIYKIRNYLIKFDLIGAYYNTNAQYILSTVPFLDRDEEIHRYLINYYNQIQRTYESYNPQYLYIGSYSLLLFNIFISYVMKNFEYCSHVDDFIIWGDSSETIMKEFGEIGSALKKHGMFINQTKSQFIDTCRDSLYFLNTIIHTSVFEVDDIAKHVLKETEDKNMNLNIFHPSTSLIRYINKERKEISSINLYSNDKKNTSSAYIDFINRLKKENKQLQDKIKELTDQLENNPVKKSGKKSNSRITSKKCGYETFEDF